MKRFSLFTLTLFFCLGCCAAVQAQTQTSPRIGLINTNAFYDEKTGITRLVNANKQLETEFQPVIKELQTINSRLQALQAELENMQKLPPAQFNQATFNAKRDEGERLQRDGKYKQEDFNNAVERRRKQLIGPINQDIGNALEEFGKKNGYGVLLDIAKLADSGAMLFLAETADATKEFITFFNTRTPATAPAK